MATVLKPVFIEATDLSDAWHNTLFKLLEPGVARKRKIDQGSYAGNFRLEFDFITGHILSPGSGSLIPEIPSQYGIPNPVDMEYVGNYFARYFMSDVKEEGEQYTYGERIVAAMTYPVAHIRRDETYFQEKVIPQTVDQIKEIVARYKEHGPGNNQMIIQIGQPADIMLTDPPCLRHIDTRIEEGKLHFFVYFRSWDLWGGFPANLAAIQLLKQYMASEIGVEDGEMMFLSKGLHLYNYVWELAAIRRGLPEEETKTLVQK